MPAVISTLVRMAADTPPRRMPIRTIAWAIVSSSEMRRRSRWYRADLSSFATDVIYSGAVPGSGRAPRATCMVLMSVLGLCFGVGLGARADTNAAVGRLHDEARAP